MLKAQTGLGLVYEKMGGVKGGRDQGQKGIYDNKFLKRLKGVKWGANNTFHLLYQGGGGRRT